jgi:hypothetical protein
MINGVLLFRHVFGNLFLEKEDFRKIGKTNQIMK